MKKETPKSEIIFIGEKPKNSIYKSTKSRIEKWIRNEQSLWFLPKYHHYKVEFQTIDQNLCSCTLEIQIGDTKWYSRECDKNIQKALQRSIDRLKIKREVKIHSRQFLQLFSENIKSA